MNVDAACSFDGSGQRLACLSSDGKIKIWDSSNGNLKQEFTPALRSDSSCTCLSWSTSKSNQVQQRKKRKRASTAVVQEKLLLGTLCGALRCFDPITEELEPLKDQNSFHVGKVNSVCFCGNNQLAYTCGEDKNIIQWTVSPTTLKSKWKVGKQAAYVITLSADGCYLLSAGRTIKLWCIETKRLLQRFAGHVNPVTMVRFSTLQSADVDKDHSVDGCYFLSWSSEESQVNAWHINTRNPEKNAIATFPLSGHATAVDCVAHLDNKQLFQICAAGSDSKLNIYSHTLNGKMKKPLQPSNTVTITRKVDEGASKSNPEEDDNIPIIAVRFNPDYKLTVVYGNKWNPLFETMSVENLPKSSSMCRKSAAPLSVDVSSLNGERQPKRPKAEPILSTAPLPTSGMAGDSRDLSQTGDDLSMEERLKSSMKVATASKYSAKQTRPNMASLTQILVQGLQSEDHNLIESVIKKGKKEFIVNATLQKLPSVFVIPFIKTLVDKIQKRPARAYVLANWIKAALSIHMTYLLSMPQLVASLSGLYQILESRTTVYSKLTKLHGRLDLLLSKTRMRPSLAVDMQVPVVSFQDGDSSGDDQDLNELLQRTDNVAESDDEWDIMEGEEDVEAEEKDVGGASEDEGNGSGNDLSENSSDDEDAEESDD